MSRNQPFAVSLSLSLSRPPSFLPPIPSNTTVYNISSSLSLHLGRKTKLNKILFLPDLSQSLSLTLSPHPPARLPALPLSSSVLILILLFIVLLSDSVFNNLMGEGFVCDVIWCNVHISNSGILSDGMFWKGQVHTLPHTGCSAHQ